MDDGTGAGRTSRRAGAEPAEGRAGWAPVGGPDGAVVLRPATEADIATCAEVQAVALEDYLVPLGQTPALNLPALAALASHLLATDPGRFVVAERDGAIVGFASAWVRGGLWFLALLFVLPGDQGRGLGRRLLEAVLPRPGERAPDGEPYILGVATDSLQPISNALYARYGMIPRMPVFALHGRISRPDAFPAPPPEVRVLAFAPAGMDEGDAVEGEGATGAAAPGAARRPGPWDDRTAVLGSDARLVADTTATVDRELLGFTRPADHRWLALTRRGVLVTDADGEPVGYGYLRGDGRIGPVGALDPALVPVIVGVLALGAPPALDDLSIIVPGAAGPTFRACLDGGLRIADPPTILAWDRPFADFSRYLPIGLALT